MTSPGKIHGDQQCNDLEKQMRPPQSKGIGAYELAKEHKQECAPTADEWRVAYGKRVAEINELLLKTTTQSTRIRELEAQLGLIRITTLRECQDLFLEGSAPYSAISRQIRKISHPHPTTQKG